MKFVSQHAFGILFFLAPAVSFAQLDSSYELLLGTHAYQSETAPVKMPKKATTPKKRGLASEEAPTNVQPAVAAPAPVTVAPSAPVETPQTAEEPSLSQQAKSLFVSNTNNVNDFYEKQFAETDPRQNKVEISFAPVFATDESSSSFSYRNYRAVYTGMNLGANVWFTPALGVGGNFMFSLGGDTSGDAVTGVRTPARFEYLDVGLKFRKFFGFSQTSKSLEFDILFSDHKMTVPADDLYRARLKTTGIGAKMTLRLPSSPEVAWLLGATFFPRLQHAEEKTGVDINSGNNVENTRVGVSLGSEINLSQQSQIFFEAAASSEKNLFDGLSGSNDPVTGAKVKNVSVSDSLYLFSIGYRWGN